MNIKFAKYLTENTEKIEEALEDLRKNFSLESNVANYIKAFYWYVNVGRPYYYLEIEDIEKHYKKNYNSFYFLYDYQALYKYNSCFCTYEDMKQELDKQLKDHSNLRLMYSYSFNEAKGKILQIPIRYVKEKNSIVFAQFVDD